LTRELYVFSCGEEEGPSSSLLVGEGNIVGDWDVELAEVPIEFDAVDDKFREADSPEGTADTDDTDFDFDFTSGESVTTVPGTLVVVVLDDPTDDEPLELVCETTVAVGEGTGVFVVVIGLGVGSGTSP